MTTRIERLTESLQKLEPTYLEIKDDSARHAGHAAMKGITGGETHLVVEIHSPKFSGRTRLEQHRIVQALCESEMSTGLHALQIKAKES